MSIIRLIPAWMHAVADYAVGGLLILLAIVVGGSAAAVATGIVVGAVIVGLSLFTRYPLGVFKIVPFAVHSAGDYLATALLLAAPLALGFSSSDTALTVIYVVAGVAVLAVSLVTNYQYGPASTPVTAPTASVSAGAPSPINTIAAQPAAVPARSTVPAPAGPSQAPTVRRPRPLVAKGR